MTTPTLLTIPFSHYCEKARWALDHAGVGYREEGHVPGFHYLATRRAGGRHTVPVLVLGGGHVLDDSPLIVRWADAQAPADRKLLPAEGPQRDQTIALERAFDVDLGPHVRRYGYFHLLPERPLTEGLMREGTPGGERLALRAVYPFLARVMRRRMQIDAPRSAASRDQIRREFDAVGARLRDGRPYLTGDRFGAADLTFAALGGPLVGPSEAPQPIPLPDALLADRAELRAHPAGEFILALYRDWRRPA
ncbi:MAG TPA: glutathione S-transferase family protein [Polyangiaceae bacterium]|nr:glutathione S-transferase family protein [Polyangiaceae bacterium]